MARARFCLCALRGCRYWVVVGLTVLIVVTLLFLIVGQLISLRCGIFSLLWRYSTRQVSLSARATRVAHLSKLKLLTNFPTLSLSLLQHQSLLVRFPVLIFQSFRSQFGLSLYFLQLSTQLLQ